MAFQDPRVLLVIRFRERKGPKQEKRIRREEKLVRKAERRAQREQPNAPAE